MISNNASALGTTANIDLGDNTYFTVGASQTIGGLTSNATDVIAPRVSLGANALTIGSTNNLDSSFAGVISGTGRIIKAGSGTLALGGNNTYTGNTTISAGTLLVEAGGRIHGSSQILVNGGSLIVNGSTGAGPVTVALGATLGGNGTIGGNVVVNGSLTPGNSPGLLSITGNMTIGATAATTMELAASGGVAGTDFDNIAVSDTLTYGGAMSITSFGGFSLNTAGTYNLFDATTAFSGNFDTVSVGLTGLTHSSGVWTGDNGVSTYTFTNSTGDLIISAIPEPGTAMLLGFGLAALAARRRRRTNA